MFQLIKSNSSGYKLLDKGNGMWQLKTPMGVFSGNLRQVCTYAVLKLEFQMKELETAVIEMEKEFHDGAEFGIMKSFMYTFESQEQLSKTGSN